MSELQPKKKARYVVVNVVDGQPVANVTVQATYPNYYNDKPSIVKKLVTNKNGEVVFDSERTTPDIYVFTNKDKAFEETQLEGSYDYDKVNYDNMVTRVFTDRGIYRPGQTVHASVIAYQNTKQDYKTKAADGQTFDMVLKDANYKEIGRKSVTTDRFGTAAADFNLPTSGLTGSFSIYADFGTKGSKRFQVDEYKRPTFDVNFDEYKEKYAVGDSIKLIGRAKSFAGVPVQGAKVHYVVTRNISYWSRFYEDSEEVNEQDVVTDDKGEFVVTVPFVLSDKAKKELKSGKSYRSLFYNFRVEASVTDAAGETHDGFTSLPLGTKEASLSCNIPEKNLRDSLKTIKFNYLNAVGSPVDGTVKYVIVPQQKDKNNYVYSDYKTAKANENVAIKGLSSGAYRLLYKKF